MYICASRVITRDCFGHLVPSQIRELCLQNPDRSVPTIWAHFEALLYHLETLNREAPLQPAAAPPPGLRLAPTTGEDGNSLPEFFGLVFGRSQCIRARAHFVADSKRSHLATLPSILLCLASECIRRWRTMVCATLPKTLFANVTNCKIARGFCEGKRR